MHLTSCAAPCLATAPPPRPICSSIPCAAAGNYDALFYALLLRARIRLGADPIPTRPASELPEALHAPYEDAIRDASRTVGQLFLDAGDIPRAWNYFRLIGEPGPIRAALESVVLREDDEFFPLVEIALHHGVHPRKGFDLILERQGICSAITTFGGFEANLAVDDRAYCARRLVQSLHEQLHERLVAEVIRHDEVAPPAGTTIPELIAGRDWLFGDDAYLIDVSHLGAVVQAAVHLPPGDAGLRPAIELCEYGARLSPKMRFPGDPPFDDLYADHRLYLQVLAGEAVDAGLAHFRQKAESVDLDEVGTRPAEVYVNLLLLAGRQTDAATAARIMLTMADERARWAARGRWSCRGVKAITPRSRRWRGAAGTRCIFWPGWWRGDSPQGSRENQNLDDVWITGHSRQPDADGTARRPTSLQRIASQRDRDIPYPAVTVGRRSGHDIRQRTLHGSDVDRAAVSAPNANSSRNIPVAPMKDHGRLSGQRRMMAH